LLSKSALDRLTALMLASGATVPTCATKMGHNPNRVDIDPSLTLCANGPLLRLIRLGGHLPKGGSDVQTDGRHPPKRRPRRRFDDHLKAEAVRPVLHKGNNVGSVARDLDLTETALREWANRARADRTNGKTGLTTAEREEPRRSFRELQRSQDGIV
jgi:transposase